MITSPSSLPLSVCMIVKNEAPQMAEALANFRPFADEIVVVDTGSTDETKTLCRQFTSRIFEFPWCDDFAAARNFSLEKARGDYILWLDADDRLQSVMQQNINKLKSYFNGRQAFYLVLENVDTSGPSWSCLQLRCAPRRPGIRFQGRVHEQLYPAIERAGIETIRTDIVIHHYGYLERNLFLQKTRRNLEILRKEHAEGRDDEQIHYYLALACQTLGQTKEAVTSMQRALDRLERRIHERPLESTTPLLQSVMEGHLFLASLYIDAGEKQPALRHLLKAGATADEDANVYYRMGLMFQKLGQHCHALECLHRSLRAESHIRFHPSEVMPTEGEILIHIALSEFCLGEAAAGANSLSRARSLGLRESESLERLGLFALQLQQWELALKAYEGVRGMGDLSADGYCNLGLLYDKQGSPTKALQCYDAAIEKAPGHPVALANRSHLCFRLNDFNRAQEGFEKLIQNQHMELDFLLPLALIALRQGDRSRFEQLAQLLSKQVIPPPLPSVCDHRTWFLQLAESFERQNKARLAAWATSIASALASSTA